MLLCSVGRNRQLVLAETMPKREPGNIRWKARGVTPSRNVSGWAEVIAKLGRTVAAGSGASGARDQVALVVEKPSLGVARK